MKKLLYTIIFILFISNLTFAQKATKIWVVRHAEKLTDNPKEKDPDLSEEGILRAKDLKDFFKGERLTFIFASNYKRTKQTASPLADDRKLTINGYDAGNQTELITTVNNLSAGKNILIVGHSNTVLSIVRALGAEISINELNDDDYDFIFEITKKGEKTTLKVMHFGKNHHSTTL
ncbi:histidine phosphatase family protein [Pedobacter alpinus]|uniref:Histidine phosphatase family protein n=1 Tax=Pedobacter alpinus TaxID=1590643 RepID=A0ABW5TP22_9SPHI